MTRILPSFSADYAAGRDEHAAAVDAMEAITKRAQREARAMRPDEEVKFDAAEQRAQVARRRMEQAERDSSALDKELIAPTRQFLYGTDARVGREELTYERFGPQSFFRDLYVSSKMGDNAARSRLERHQEEMAVERRDLSSTDGVGGDFVSPLWMAAEWLPLSRAARPFANAVRQLPLPGGTDSINLPRILTGAATSAQTDLGAVQETDPTTGSVTVPVKTIAGQVDMARQVLDRSAPGMDEVIFQDLVADYHTKLDAQVLTGSGSGANAKGVLSDSNRIQVTYTDTTATVGEFYSKLADIIQRIQVARFLPPTLIALHPRRWSWILAAADSTGRPLVSPVAGQNSPGSIGTPAAEGAVGTLMGLPVIIDANIPTTLGAGTNEDVAIVTRASDLILFESGAPVTRVYEEVLSGNLAVRVQAYGYYAFSSERYSAASGSISGTGMTAPVF